MGEGRGNYWVALPGATAKASPEQMRPAGKEERHAWRMVEAELRIKMAGLEHYSGQRFEGATGGERSPEAAKEAPPIPAAPESPMEASDGGDRDAAGRGNDRADEAGSDNGAREHPTGWRRLRDKQAADKRALEEAHQPDEG